MAEVIQIRATDARKQKLEHILAHLRAMGLNPNQADALDFAISAALEKIAKEKQERA